MKVVLYNIFIQFCIMLCRPVADRGQHAVQLMYLDPNRLLRIQTCAHEETRMQF